MSNPRYWSLTLDFAARVGVPVREIGEVPAWGEWHPAPWHGYGIDRDLATVLYLGRERGAWEVLLHEVSHVVWMHPTKPLSVEPEESMIVYEAAVCAAMGGPRMRAAYMSTDYVQLTTFYVDVDHREVANWRRPLASGWARAGRAEGKARGVLDDLGRPTWQRARWA